MLTLDGARALGFDGSCGSLAPGKDATLVILPLPDDEPSDPHALLFAGNASPSHVLFRGEWRSFLTE